MAGLLDPEAVQGALEHLDGWNGGPDGLRRTVRATTFLDGIRLVTQVAEAAEAMDHHPDIDIRWRSISFALVTHSAGGVTDLDVTLAGRIDDLARELGAS